MANCKQLLVTLVEEHQRLGLGLGVFNLYSEEDCGNSIEEQVKTFFGITGGVIHLDTGQYLYSYELEFQGDGWSYDAKLVNNMDDTIYLYKIGNDAE